MRVKCSYCGKKYDNLTYNNQCPFCGNRYYGEASMDYVIPDAIMGEFGDGADTRETPDVIEDAWDGGRNMEVLSGTVFQSGGKQIGKASDSVLPKVKRGIYILFCIVFTGLVLLMDIAFLGIHLEKNERKKRIETRQEQLEKADDYHMEEEYYDYSTLLKGEPIPYVNSYGENISIYLQSIRTFEDTRMPMPEGYEVLELCYKLEDGKGDSENVYGMNIDAFMVSKSGAYITPLSYEVDDIINYDSDSKYDAHIDYDFEYKEGYMYFVLKEGDADDLLLICKHRGEDYSNDAIIKRIYISDIVVDK